MTASLTKDELEALRRITSPTVANAIETFGLGNLVGASAIVGVPEGVTRELSASPDGTTLIAGGDFGVRVVYSVALRTAASPIRGRAPRTGDCEEFMAIEIKESLQV